MLEKLAFDSHRERVIDGLLQDVKNQDGIDLRNGCHDITISDISGRTGDDTVALTAIAGGDFRPAGSLCGMHVMANDWTLRERDIYNVTIRNVRAYTHACHIIRLLPCEARIYDITVNGVIDTSPAECVTGGIFLGDRDGAYGRNLPGSLTGITISNYLYNSTEKPLRVDGYLQNSLITNVVNSRSQYPAIAVSREDGLQNVKINNIVAPKGIPVV